MKKRLFMALLACLTFAIGNAQTYTSSKYYNTATGKLDYHQRAQERFNNIPGDYYYGLRLGAAFSTTSSENKFLEANNSKTGLNLGVVAGFELSDEAPLYLETGLYYIQKGGKSDLYYGSDPNVTRGKMSYNAEYLELPLTVKYIYTPDDVFSIQPLVGVYMACGVGGKIKDYKELVAYGTFDSDFFRRWDAGLRLGCGIGYDMFYAELAYDLGLANIGHGAFDTTHTRSLQLTAGVNF